MKNFDNIKLSCGKAVDVQFLNDISKHKKKFKNDSLKLFYMNLLCESSMIYYFNKNMEEIGSHGIFEYGILNNKPIKWSKEYLNKLIDV